MRYGRTNFPIVILFSENKLIKENQNGVGKNDTRMVRVGIRYLGIY